MKHAPFNPVDQLELACKGQIIMVIDTSAHPQVDEIIALRGRFYRVTSRNWAIDNGDDVFERRMRLFCNVTEVTIPKKPAKKKVKT